MFNDLGVGGALPALGTTPLVECKNYEHRVGGQEVAWFDHKLIQSGSDCGILIAANGVTGEARDKTFAQGVIAEALRARPTRRILVVTIDEIAPLASTTDLRDLLIRKIMDAANGQALQVP